jgi:hypothetical protein
VLVDTHQARDVESLIFGRRRIIGSTSVRTFRGSTSVGPFGLD